MLKWMLFVRATKKNGKWSEVNYGRLSFMLTRLIKGEKISFRFVKTLD